MLVYLVLLIQIQFSFQISTEKNALIFKNCPIYVEGSVRRSNSNVLHFVSRGNFDPTFNQANEYCKLCYDASLPMHNEINKILKIANDKDFALWIGLIRMPNSSQWTWLDGTPLDNWMNYASTFNDVELNSQKIQTVLLMQINKIVTFLSVENGMLCKDLQVHFQDQRNSRITPPCGLEVPFLPPSVRRYSYETRSKVEFICQRPSRMSCHYWNYTEPECYWSEIMGSHNYRSFLFHLGDNDVQNKCKQPEHQRYVYRCRDELSCPVTEWSEWSLCSANYCREGRGNRTRTRKRQEVRCQQNSYFAHLKEIESCKVVGCND